MMRLKMTPEMIPGIYEMIGGTIVKLHKYVNYWMITFPSGRKEEWENKYVTSECFYRIGDFPKPFWYQQ